MSNNYEDDYGVEMPKSASAEPKKPATAKKQVVELNDEFEVSPKVVEKPKVVEAPKVTKKTIPEPEDVDEEAMYGESVKLEGQVKINDHDAPETKPKHDLSQTIFIFREDELFVNCFRQTTGWYMGDVNNGMRVPDYCSIAKVDATEHKTDLMDGIISGGAHFGSATQCVTGFSFQLDQVNTVDTINCSINAFLPNMTSTRFMHQSCIVRGKSGFWTLLVLGGK